MKVLYVTNDSLNYGSNKSTLNLALALKDKIDVEFLIPKSGPLEEELKRRKITYKKSRYFSAVVDLDVKEKKYKRIIKNLINKIKVKLLRRYYKDRNIDIIHSVNSACILGGLLSLELNVKYVQHIRELGEEDHNFTFYDKKYVYSLFNRADKIICISKCVYDKYSKILDRSKMCMIYNGIPLEKYSINKEKHDVKNILIAGTISKTKGQLDALLAIESLVNEGINNIHLYIAGEGPMEEELKILMARKHLKNYISFLGYVKDMKSLREKIDINLVCSRFEAFGRVTVEAMASNCLVIGTNSGGTSEIISPYETGLLYDFGNYKELAEKIKYAIKSEVETKKMIKSAREHVVNNFSIETCANKVLKEYKKIYEGD